MESGQEAVQNGLLESVAGRGGGGAGDGGQMRRGWAQRREGIGRLQNGGAA